MNGDTEQTDSETENSRADTMHGKVKRRFEYNVGMRPRGTVNQFDTGQHEWNTSELSSEGFKSIDESGPQHLLQALWEDSAAASRKKKRRLLAPQSNEQRVDVLDAPQSDSNRKKDKPFHVPRKSLGFQAKIFLSPPGIDKNLKAATLRDVPKISESTSLKLEKRHLPSSSQLKEEHRLQNSEPFTKTNKISDYLYSNDVSSCSNLPAASTTSLSSCEVEEYQSIDVDHNVTTSETVSKPEIQVCLKSRQSIGNSYCSTFSHSASPEISRKVPFVVMHDLNLKDNPKISNKTGFSRLNYFNEDEERNKVHETMEISESVDSSVKIPSKRCHLGYPTQINKDEHVDMPLLNLCNSSASTVSSHCTVFSSKADLRAMERYLMSIVRKEFLDHEVSGSPPCDVKQSNENQRVTNEPKDSSPEDTSVNSKLNVRRSKRARRVVNQNPKQQIRQTPMGLPKPLRLNKIEFTVEEIYQNKNFQTPKEKMWETIFEFPKENKDGTVSNHEKKKKRRRFDFSTDPSARKSRRKKHKWKRRKLQASFEGDADEILRQKLESLETDLRDANLSP